MFKKYLLAGALAGAFSIPAYAAGTGTLADPFTGFGTCNASGSFCISNPDADDKKMFLNDNEKNVNTFFGDTLGNGNVDTIRIDTQGFVDHANGFSTIKPIKDGTLFDALFTPQNPFTYDGFFTRAQLEFNDPTPPCKGKDCPAPAAPPTSVNVILQVNGTIFFSFAEPTPWSNDFADIGFDEPGENEKLAGLVTSVHMFTDNPLVSFKEIKQVQWSPCADGGGCGLVINPTGGAPEPSTWAMGIIGFGVLGFMGYRRSLQRPARIAA